jgi:hypothetical protein
MKTRRAGSRRRGGKAARRNAPVSLGAPGRDMAEVLAVSAQGLATAQPQRKRQSG